MMLFTNKVYDIISKIQRWLPAIGVFYLTVSKIWGIPFGSEINETVVALATLLAALLEVSSARYYRAEAKLDE